MAQIGAYNPLLNGYALQSRPAAAPQARSAEQAGPADSVGIAAPRGVCFLPNGDTIYLPGPGQTLTVGRDAKSDVVLGDKDVSRRHAQFTEKDGQHYVRDVGSTFGTFVNDECIKPNTWVAFRPGDSLRLGNTFTLERSSNDLPEHLPRLELPKSGGSLTVGRSPENSLVTPWPDASRSHAVIQEKGGQSWLLDKGSGNGTYVNGKKIPSQQWVTLQPGHKVQFGNSPGAAFSVAAAKRAEAFEALSPAAADAILRKAQFAANPIGVRPFGAPDCTQDFLRAHGLEPKTTFVCGDQKIHFSQPYNLGKNRAACVGYVEDAQGQTRVRAFYRSDSQGLWRSASHCSMGGWIGKGDGEDTTNLPIALQAALHSQADHQVKEMDEASAHQAFYGTLEFAGHEVTDELKAELKAPQKIGTFAATLPGGKYGVPESYSFANPGTGPDFSKADIHYTFNHPVHGKIDADAFTSKNGDCSFLFYRDSHGLSWLAQVEQQASPLTSWGTRATPVEHKNLAMPAVEYHSQIPQGYAGKSISVTYGDASAYVHKLPVVAAYRQAIGIG